eukprot:gene16527-22751_t
MSASAIVDELNASFDIAETVAFVRKHGYKRVALQFPDDLLDRASAVADALSSYLVHYGHASLATAVKLPTFYVFPKHVLDCTAAAKAIHDALATSSSASPCTLLLLVDQAHAHLAQALAGEVQKQVQAIAGEVQNQVQAIAGEVQNQALAGEVQNQVQAIAGEVQDRVQALAGEVQNQVQAIAGEVQKQAQGMQVVLADMDLRHSGSALSDVRASSPVCTSRQPVSACQGGGCSGAGPSATSSTQPLKESLNPNPFCCKSGGPTSSACDPGSTVPPLPGRTGVSPDPAAPSASEEEPPEADGTAVPHSKQAPLKSVRAGSGGGYHWVLPDGCTSDQDCTFAWVGSSATGALQLLQLAYSTAAWLCCDSSSEGSSGSGGASLAVTQELTAQTKALLKRRYYLVEKTKSVNIVGILVGTLATAGFRDVVSLLRRLAKDAGKKTYTLLIGKPSPAKLANFPEVEVFVMVADPQGFVLDSKEYLAPIITPYEAVLAFTDR